MLLFPLFHHQLLSLSTLAMYCPVVSFLKDIAITEVFLFLTLQTLQSLADMCHIRLLILPAE